MTAMRQKPRHPATLAHAVTSIIERVGVAACAKAVFRSERLIYDWADPDHDARPNFLQGKALDALWLAAERSALPAESPIASWYLAELERDAFERGQAPSPMARVVELLARCGGLAEEVEAANVDGLLTPNEKTAIAERAEKVRLVAAKIVSEIGG